MCGISGIIGQGWDLSQLEAMVDIQHHRGPDDSGLWMDSSRHVGLGHNRLSIIDLTSAGSQPMPNRDETIWIIFNGEIYNYLELRVDLDDYPYRSRSDTEVILAAYERWGEKCVEHFIGMFAFAIWDMRQHLLFCARDRLGIKPFHYTQKNDEFVFASEIKAILASGCPAEPNWEIIATYLTHGLYDHSDSTFYKDIFSLPPGHTLILENGDLKINSFWHLPKRAESSLDISDEEAVETFNSLLTDSVRLRLRSDVPIGLNLSGGLDSASLMVYMDDLLGKGGEIQTFTSTWPNSVYDETEFAFKVPKKGKWIANVSPLQAHDVWNLARDSIWFQEAPIGGISTLAYHNLHSLSHEKRVKVLLEGQGVDEILAGYEYFLPAFFSDLYEDGRWLDLRREIRQSHVNNEESLDSIRRFSRLGFSHNYYQDGTIHLRPSCIDPEIIELAGEIPSFPQPFPNHLNNVLYRDIRFAKLPRVLRMNDRLSMAFSRELREPFLDHRIVEFIFRLPYDKKIRNGHNKFLLRHAMKNRLPEDVRLAKKRAVVAPQREWLRTILSGQIRDLINSKSFKERGLFNVSKVKEEFNKYSSNEKSNSFFIWQWVNIEMWFSRFIDMN